MVSIIDLQDLFQTLGLKEEEMNDFIPNTNRETNHICNYCSFDCYGDVYTFYIRETKTYQERKHMCEICYDNRQDKSIKENYKEECSIYLLKLSYAYKIIALNKINNTEYIYVVQEENLNENDQDIHYYLKYYKDGYIYIDHEIQTYNSYFGCQINTIEKLQDDIIHVNYNEKHNQCDVQIKMNVHQKHQIWMKSKPNTYLRSQNNLSKEHEIGEIIQFMNNNTISKTLSYNYPVFIKCNDDTLHHIYTILHTL
jgi:hypothetical protein